MRATFTTSFIYDGADGYLDRKAKLCEVLDVEMDLKGGIMIGQISGITKGLDLDESDIHEYIKEMCHDLYGISIVDFRIVWLFEGGDIEIREIFGKPKYEEEIK